MQCYLCSVCIVQCRAIRCAQCVLVTSLLCTQTLLSTQTVCNVRAANKVGIAQYARCALCKCRERFAVCRVFQCPGCLVHKLCTVPPHPCAMSVYLVGCAMLGVHSVKQSPSQVQIAAQRPRPLPPAYLLCSVCAVYIVCTIPTSDGACRGSQVPPFSSQVCGNRVNSVLLA